MNENSYTDGVSTTRLYSHVLATLKEKGIKASHIEQNTQMSYSSVSRTLNEKRDFTPLEYAELLNYIYTPSEARETAAKFAPNDEALIKLVSDVGSEEIINETQEAFLTNYKSFSIANLIELGYFNNETQVKEVFGLAGVKILNDMNKEKLISLSSDGNIKNNFVKIKPSFASLRKQIALSADYHKDENCGKMKNFIYFGTKLVSKETRTFIQVSFRLFKEIISSILHVGEVAPNKVDNLSAHLKSFTYNEKLIKTEPIYCSMLLDDFKSTDDNKGVLQ